MTPEGKVKSDVKDALELLELTGDVMWYERLNSGSIHRDNQHIYMCRPGTFDFIAVIQNEQHDLMVIFIECKREDRPAKYSPTQQMFYDKYFLKHPNLIFILVQSGEQVKREILSRCYNRINDITMGG